MKNIYGLILILTGAFLLSGCGQTHAVYSISLNKVERPADATKRYGNSKITSIVEKNKNDRTLFHLNARIQVFSHFRIVPKFTVYTRICT